MPARIAAVLKAAIVGRLSMGSTVIDITNAGEIYLRKGDFVELWEPNHTIDEVAHDANTIAYEVLTSRVHGSYRTYLDDTPRYASPISRFS